MVSIATWQAVDYDVVRHKKEIKSLKKCESEGWDIEEAFLVIKLNKYSSM